MTVTLPDFSFLRTAINTLFKKIPWQDMGKKLGSKQKKEKFVPDHTNTH